MGVSIDRDHMSQNDEEIVRRIQQGEKQAFGEIVERYEKKILRYARRFLLEETDAADLTQEVFIKAYVNIRSFDSKRRFSPWLYRIAHNEFITALRKKKREPLPLFETDSFLPRSLVVVPDDFFDRAESKKKLDACLGELDARYREPLILYYFEQLSYQDIADILQVPPSTVGTRLKRGRNKLKEIYERKKH